MLRHFKDNIYYDDITLECYTPDENGELQPMHKTLTAIDNGSSVRTPEQQKASREHFKNIEKLRQEQTQKFYEIALKAEKERLENEIKPPEKPPIELRQSRKPNFFWIYNDTLCDIAPANATRLVMLASYMNYQGQIMRTRKTPMTLKDLQDILKLNRSKVYQFLNETKDFIYATDDGIYFKDDCNIFRGQLPKVKEFEHYQRVFCKSVQKLFSETDKSKLKPLGYVFQILPFINLDYNVIAISDPYETDFDKLQPLTTKQFCEIIGYDTSQSSRLKRELKSLQFEYKDRKEYLLMYINTTEDISTEKIVINPHIIYNGTQYENVEKFGSFCRVPDKTPRHFGDKPKLTKKA